MTRRQSLVAAAALLSGFAACMPVTTIAPKDASFALSCSDGCGTTGRDNAIAIDVTFLKDIQLRATVCCDQEREVLAQLMTVRDFWCDGLDVPPKTIGHLTIGTTTSGRTGKRGATIDQGQGFIAFNCDDWLPKLITELQKRPCCKKNVQQPR